MSAQRLLALLWQILVWRVGKSTAAVRAWFARRSGETVNDSLSDLWQARFRWRARDSFFPLWLA